MSLDIQLKSNNTSLLVIDMQRDFFTRKDSDDPIDDLELMNEIIKPVESFIKSIRELGVSIVFTKYVEKEGGVPSNIQAKHLDGMCKLGSKGDDLYISEFNEENDYVFEKYTWDAFSNKDLDRYLKEKSIENLIIVGVTLSCCVFSTVSAAFSHGYNVIVPMELVAGKKRTLHLRENILEAIQRYYGFVINKEEILNNLIKN